MISASEIPNLNRTPLGVEMSDISEFPKVGRNDPCGSGNTSGAAAALQRMRNRPDNTSEHRIGIGSVLDSCNRVEEVFMENSQDNQLAFSVRAPDVPERFVDAPTAAKFLSISQRSILLLARQGELPAHPLGQGPRRIWRFRLSELAKAMEERTIYKKGVGTLGESRSSRSNRS